jgi:hypothetical protein
MLRAHRSEREIVAMVRSLTGEPAPPGRLASALRGCLARLGGVPWTR